MWPGFTPYEISKTLLTANFQQEWAAYHRPGYSVAWTVDDSPPWLILLGVLSLVVYFVGALTLTIFSLTRFQAVAGRARLSKVKGQAARLPSLVPRSRGSQTHSMRPAIPLTLRVRSEWRCPVHPP